MPDLALDLAWGASGLRAEQASSTAIAIVDVLSFSTAVDVAVSRGARVLPYRCRDTTAAGFAAAQGAQLAGPLPLYYGSGRAERGRRGKPRRRRRC